MVLCLPCQVGDLLIIPMQLGRYFFLPSTTMRNEPEANFEIKLKAKSANFIILLRLANCHAKLYFFTFILDLAPRLL